ncbi:hypothetical protein KAW18_17730 [candidate division WOR-3 bacterium]|nr:hypothetical protein [candidate division WOR-3 bacterium]
MTSEKGNWQGDAQIIDFFQEKLVDEGLSEEEYEEMDSIMKSTGMRS